MSDPATTMGAMHGSSVVDLALEVLPRALVKALLLTGIAIMTIFDWWEPAIWYVFDKAAALTEVLLPAFNDYLAQALG